MMLVVQLCSCAVMQFCSYAVMQLWSWNSTPNFTSLCSAVFRNIFLILLRSDGYRSCGRLC